jgi:hypothetical protein
MTLARGVRKPARATSGISASIYIYIYITYRQPSKDTINMYRKL